MSSRSLAWPGTGAGDIQIVSEYDWTVERDVDPRTSISGNRRSQLPSIRAGVRKVLDRLTVFSLPPDCLTIGDMDLFSGDFCPDGSDSRCPVLTSLLSLLEKGAALLWTTDRELRLDAVTGVVSQDGAPTPRRCVGVAVEELFVPQASHLSPIQAHRMALAGIGAQFDAMLAGRDLSAHVEPLRGAPGEILGVIGIAIDNTERLVAERAVRLSEQNYRTLVEGAPYAICRATQSGRMLQVNRAMLDMLHYGAADEADLLARDLPFIFADKEGFAALQNQLMENNTTQGLESTWVCRDGRRIQVRLGGRAARDAAGSVLCFDVLAEDITEKKQLESRLNQAQKMQAVGQLAGGIAHDFNNLLTVISGQIEVVLGRTADEDLRTRLIDAKRAAERAAGLTGQLLAFSRRQVLQSKPVDLNNLIEHLQQMLGRLIREDITLTFHPGHHIGLVNADPNQLEQVLINLVVNAQDAMPYGGQLTIQTTTLHIAGEASARGLALEPGVYVLASVRDTGIGMDSETQARIFEPFFTTKKVGEGTGLGLSMAYGVIKQSGGDIQVESRPGTGSTFKVYLPQIPGPPTEQEDVAAHSVRGRETVLLAEDEDSVKNLVAGHLQSLGYEVLAASNGAVALELARSHPGRIDLLLSDLVMPNMGGRDLARVLHGDRSHMKVIFVSGYAHHSSAGMDLEIPTAYFLPKPFSMDQLAKAIRDVLDVPEVRR